MRGGGLRLAWRRCGRYIPTAGDRLPFSGNFGQVHQASRPGRSSSLRPAGRRGAVGISAAALISAWHPACCRHQACLSKRRACGNTVTAPTGLRAASLLACFGAAGGMLILASSTRRPRAAPRLTLYCRRRRVATATMPAPCGILLLLKRAALCGLICAAARLLRRAAGRSAAAWRAIGANVLAASCGFSIAKLADRAKRPGWHRYRAPCARRFAMRLRLITSPRRRQI